MAYFARIAVETVRFRFFLTTKRTHAVMIFFVGNRSTASFIVKHFNSFMYGAYDLVAFVAIYYLVVTTCHSASRGNLVLSHRGGGCMGGKFAVFEYFCSAFSAGTRDIIYRFLSAGCGAFKIPGFRNALIESMRMNRRILFARNRFSLAANT